MNGRARTTTRPILLVAFAAGIASCGRAPMPAAATTPAPAPAPTISPELRETLRQGSALSTAGEQDSALVVYRRAAERWPDSYNVEAGLGTVLDLLGRFDEARTHWRRAIAVGTAAQAAGAYQQLAVSYTFECRTEDAARAEQQALNARLATQDFTGAAGVYNELGRIFLECGQVDRALTAYRQGYETASRAVPQTDTVANLWSFRWAHAQARIAARRGNDLEAQRHIQTAKGVLARGMNPDQVQFLPYLTGYVAFHRGDYDTAIADLQQASQTDPFILSLLARSYEKRGATADAESYWKKARAIHAHGITVAFARRAAAMR